MHLRFAILLTLIFANVRANESLADAGPPQQPRLVVIVVVDQLRADYLTRFEPWFGDDGFRRLMHDGVYFANTHLNALDSETAPGHATIATGATPRVHGIVSNKWFMDTGVAEASYAVYDESCEAVPPEERAGRGRSPHLLQAPTLGDQMKLADRRTRVVSISLKDRAAIFLGGHLADAALWWNVGDGHFVTSTYYGDTLPDFVQAFNAADPTKKYADYVWTPIVPASAMEGAYPIDAKWRLQANPEDLAFPHRLPSRDASFGRFAGALWSSPAGNNLVMDLVENAIPAEHLGEDDVPDLLCVGLSANDSVGHHYGPQSAEVMDMTVQTDRQVARLLAMLDKQVGRGRYVLALAADHGVKAVPQLLESLRLDGGTYDPRQLGRELNTHLTKAFFNSGEDPIQERLIVVGVEVPWVYFNMRLIESLPAEKQAALFASAEQFLSSKEFISDAYGPETLAGTAPPETDAYRLMAWNSWNPRNGGQICMRVKTGWKKRDANLAGHSAGSIHERHVPLLFYGSGVAAGRRYTPATPCDLVVTLSALLGIEPPIAAQGQVLHEAISSQ